MCKIQTENYSFACGRNTVAPRQYKSNKFVCIALGFCVYLRERFMTKDKVWRGIYVIH